MLDKSGQPKKPIQNGLSQPPTIKIQWSNRNGREMSCGVMLDKAEYALTYTTPDLETNLLARWDKDYKNNPKSDKEV